MCLFDRLFYGKNYNSRKGVRYIYIFIDVYFGYNFLIDLSVIFATGEILNKKSKWYRMILAALAGAIYSVLTLFLKENIPVKIILTYLIVAEIMIILAFGKMDFRANVKAFLVMYGATFLLNGIMNLFNKNNSMLLSIVIAVTCNSIIRLLAKLMLKEAGASKNLLKIIIKEGKCKVDVTALVDTGNNLFEPMTGKPVSIIEKTVAEKIINENSRFTFIAFKSLGKENGLLKGVFCEYIEVNGNRYNNQIVGIYNGKLSNDNMYHMILHPKLLE